jgi:diguanylate cyclase (GGDEF)-like protein/PAS domain S-box-containing protein
MPDDPIRRPSASELASWEDEGGRLLADGCIASCQGRASGEIGEPLELNDLARVTLDSIADAVISTDANGHVVYLNATAAAMTGWTLQQAAGRPLAEVFRIADATTGRPAHDPALRAIAEGRAVKLALNCVLVRRDGSEIEIEDSAAPIHDRNERLVGAVVVFRDVRFSHAMVERMLHLARQDPLTGKANRYSLVEQFDLARRMAKRHSAKIGLLFIDIDRFKSINDTFGHEAGDEVLIAVSKRLASCLREADTLCRYGGDEFVVLLSDTQRAEDVAPVVDKLHSTMSAPELIVGQAMKLSLSIGSSLYPDDGEDLDTLVRLADQVMFQNKSFTGRAGRSVTGGQ